MIVAQIVGIVGLAFFLVWGCEELEKIGDKNLAKATCQDTYEHDADRKRCEFCFTAAKDLPAYAWNKICGGRSEP